MAIKRFKEKHLQNSRSTSLFEQITAPQLSKISPSLDVRISKPNLTKFKIETPKVSSENKDLAEISKKTQHGQNQENSL